ncbi:MAG: [FeFe] hydrogenase H-cluster radical SAM maturase HydE [Candidatus Omnitrophica bacterium]|nr:[FeFe] hydrogenase H-cluster radical SAM maturase HydE [Candidatus Omnitrophota bacterium]
MVKESMLSQQMSIEHIEAWLRETRNDKLSLLWQTADKVRKDNVADAVHLRGLVEISNHCVRSCAYCGLRAPRKEIQRYRMTADEIITCAHQAAQWKYGTLVMQAGEDYGIKAQWLAEVIERIKKETPLAVTLSLGERSYEEFKLWRNAGADRYLLRFETTDKNLYNYIHPPLAGRSSDRIAILKDLRTLGYEIGSGVMVGIPGQSYTSLARDIDCFRKLNLDMVGIGPYIEHPDTPLGRNSLCRTALDRKDRVPNDELLCYKAVALTRIVCPQANIPSTTALATINPTDGRELGLRRGANVVMPNLTPFPYRSQYEIYPGKACMNEDAQRCQGCLTGRIVAIGRTMGLGVGSRL